MELTGMRFGKLIVLHRAAINGRAKYDWICQCDCGNIHKVYQSNLTGGSCISCGCYGKTLIGARTRKHGMRQLPEYDIWKGIRARCYNPQRRGYPRYGGRGIIMCDRWRDDFTAFYQDMGPRPTLKHSIDRIDNDGPYAPDNCRWATNLQQANNRDETYCRGENNWKSKLTENDVFMLRDICIPGDSQYGFRAMARKLGVDSHTIRSAYYGISWAHLG